MVTEKCTDCHGRYFNICRSIGLVPRTEGTCTKPKAVGVATTVKPPATNVLRATNDGTAWFRSKPRGSPLGFFMLKILDFVGSPDFDVGQRRCHMGIGILITLVFAVAFLVIYCLMRLSCVLKRKYREAERFHLPGAHILHVRFLQGAAKATRSSDPRGHVRGGHYRRRRNNPLHSLTVLNDPLSRSQGQNPDRNAGLFIDIFYFSLYAMCEVNFLQRRSMRRIMSVWKREEIAQKTWMTFLGFALISFTLTSFGPIQMTEIQLMRYIMRDPGGMSDLLLPQSPRSSSLLPSAPS